MAEAGHAPWGRGPHQPPSGFRSSTWWPGRRVPPEGRARCVDGTDPWTGHPDRTGSSILSPGDEGPGLSLTW